MSAAAFLMASAALSAVGSISAGKAAAAEAEFSASMLRRQADRAIETAEAEAKQFRKQQSGLLARARALGAGSGITINEGSPLLVDDSRAVEIALGEQSIRVGGQERASSLEADARLRQFRGSNERSQKFFNAGKTLLTATGNNFDAIKASLG